MGSGGDNNNRKIWKLDNKYTSYYWLYRSEKAESQASKTQQTSQFIFQTLRCKPDGNSETASRGDPCLKEQWTSKRLSLVLRVKAAPPLPWNTVEAHWLVAESRTLDQNTLNTEEAEVPSYKGKWKFIDWISCLLTKMANGWMQSLQSGRESRRQYESREVGTTRDFKKLIP